AAGGQEVVEVVHRGLVRHRRHEHPHVPILPPGVKSHLKCTDRAQTLRVCARSAVETCDLAPGQRPRSRPISIFMISLEPAQILVTGASRQSRATRYSFM